jgi:hypothetical protein
MRRASFVNEVPQMTMSTRDRRALVLLGVGLLVILIWRFGVYGDKQAPVVAASDSIPLAEKRLARLRQIAAGVPGKETILKNVSSELAAREKGMIVAETAAQAQAQILQIVRKIGKSAGVDVRPSDIGQARKLGDYGEVAVGVTFECRIEQLVNLLADLANQPELLATSDIRVASGNAKEKTVNVRLGLSAVVPRKLIPEKKGPVAF